MENYPPPHPEPVVPPPNPVPPAGPAPAPNYGDVAAQVYPAAAPVPPPPSQPMAPTAVPEPPRKVSNNPFSNMVRGFIKFAKTNLLLMVVYTILTTVFSILLFLVLLKVFGGSGNLGGGLVILFAFFGFIMLFGAAFSLVWSKLLLDGVRGHRSSFKQSLAPLKKSWIPIVYILLFALFIVGFWFLIIGLAIGSGGNGLVFFPLIGLAVGLFVIYLFIRWSFTLFTIVDYPDSNLINSIKRGSKLTKGHRWALFFYWLLAIIISVIISAVTGSNSKPTYYSGSELYGAQLNQPQRNSGKEAAGGIVESIVGLFIYAGFAEFYRQIKDGQEPPATVSAPTYSAPPPPAPVYTPPAPPQMPMTPL